MMHLWLLTAIGGAVGYDCFDGFVVCAADEVQARALAQAAGGDEVRKWSDDEDKPYWTDPKKVRCTLLVAEGEPGIILGSFNAG